MNEVYLPQMMNSYTYQTDNVTSQFHYTLSLEASHCVYICCVAFVCKTLSSFHFLPMIIWSLSILLSGKLHCALKKKKTALAVIYIFCYWILERRNNQYSVSWQTALIGKNKYKYTFHVTGIMYLTFFFL